MENKKTTELLDLLKTLTNEKGEVKNTEQYDKVEKELYFRTPFFTLLHEDSELSVGTLLERIESLEDEIKKLKRHKHDEKSGDVLIRI